MTQVTPTGYCQMVAVGWYFYEYLLSFGDEVEYIWARTWTWSKILFLLTRYLTMLLLVGSATVYVLPGLGEDACNSFDWAAAFGTFAVVILVEAILQLRIYLLYGKSRKILITNLLLFVLHVGCAAALVAVYFPQQVFAPVPAGVLGSCYDYRLPQLSAVWATPLAYELYLTVLAVYKIREQHSLRDPLGGTSLIVVLARDSVVYFFLITFVIIVNIFLWTFTSTPGNSAVSLIHVGGAIGGCRLIISLRRAVSDPTVYFTVTPTTAFEFRPTRTYGTPRSSTVWEDVRPIEQLEVDDS